MKLLLRLSAITLLVANISCAAEGYHNSYGMSLLGPYIIPVRNEKRPPTLDDVVGSGTETINGQQKRTVIVQVPGHDKDPFGIYCDYDQFHGKSPVPWPDGPPFGISIVPILSQHRPSRRLGQGRADLSAATGRLESAQRTLEVATRLGSGCYIVRFHDSNLGRTMVVVSIHYRGPRLPDKIHGLIAGHSEYAHCL